MTTMTTRLARRPLLPLALRLDAVVTGANGAAYLVAAGPLGDLLGLSPALLRGAGAALLAFAAVVWLAPARPGRAVTAIVAANAAYAAGCLVAAILGAGSPTAAGTVWIVLQALVVAGFAELQLAGARRMLRR